MYYLQFVSTFYVSYFRIYQSLLMIPILWIFYQNCIYTVNRSIVRSTFSELLCCTHRLIRCFFFFSIALIISIFSRLILFYITCRDLFFFSDGPQASFSVEFFNYTDAIQVQLAKLLSSRCAHSDGRRALELAARQASTAAYEHTECIKKTVLTFTKTPSSSIFNYASVLLKSQRDRY